MIEVLIADNNIQLCAALTEFLNAQGDMEVVGCAYDGEEALDMIEKISPDVVVLDITMPRLDGLAVLERLDELNLKKRPRVIVLTALARDDIAQRFTEMGADYYMLKPFDMELLADRIRQFATGQAPEAGVRTGHAPGAASGRPGSDHHRAATRWACRHFKGYQYLREGADDGHGAGLWAAASARHLSAPGDRQPRPGRGSRHPQRIDRLLEKGNRQFLKSSPAGPSVREGRFPQLMVIAKLADRFAQLRAS